VHDGAIRYDKLQRLAGGTVAVASLALLAVGRALVRVVVEVEQGMGVAVDDQDHVAAVAAVAAVRAAERLELLAVDRRAAVTAGARGDVQHDAVDEAGHEGTGEAQPPTGAAPTGADSTGTVPTGTACAGTMLTIRRLRRMENCTAPASRANKVSSLPRPTAGPGWKWVPRCRTMISPALTTWPP